MGENDNLKGSCKVVVEDAVYLILETPFNAKPADKQEIMRQIEAVGVVDFDISAILKALKQIEPYMKIKISSNANIKIVNESAIVDISKDKMEALIRFEKPNLGGKTLTPEQIVKCIEASGIRYGLNKRLVQVLVSKREYNKKYVIAVGKKPSNGADGSLEYKFDINPKTNRPKILEDGRVDFRQIDYFESVLSGQTLVTIVPPTPGIEGTNVLGEAIPAKPGKLAPRLPKGKNTRVSADEMSLTAETSGHIIYTNNKVEISPVLEIRSDVGLSTGHIDFAGDVIVRGSVNTGFSVKATGSIDVYETVEGASIDAEGDVNLYSGVQGMERAVIISGGNLFMRYAENALMIDVKGDITADCIMHSNVKCGGSLRLEGRKCVLVGGKIDVARAINARRIGSNMNTVTDISTGHQPDNLEKFNELKKELAAAKELYEKNDKAASIIIKGGDLQSLPAEKKELLVKIMHAKAFYRDKIQSLQTQISDLASLLSTNNGEINVSKKIYAGTKIIIGNALMYAREDIEACTLKNVDGHILVGSYDEAKAKTK